MTLEVSKEDKFKDTSEEQPWNMLSMYVTLDVLKEDRLREESEEQP